MHEIRLQYPVRPDWANTDSIEPNCLRQGQAGALESPGRRRAPEELGSRKGDDAAHESRLDECPRKLAAPLHEDPAYVEGAEPGHKVAHVHVPLVRLALEHRDSSRLEVLQALRVGGVRDCDERAVGLARS